MDFTLTDDERAVTEAAAQVAASDDPWAALVDGGWLNVLAEDERGLGYLGLVAEALGAAGVGVPLAGSAVVWPTLFERPAGARRVGVADTLVDPLATDPDGAPARGAGLLCEDGLEAQTVVVLENHAARAYDSFSTGAVGGLDGDGLARVRLEGSAVDSCQNPERVGEARRRAAAVTASEMAGAIDRVATLTAAYVAERQQFGRPISAFQVVAHGAAHLATLAQGALWSARLACRSPDPTDTAAAKGWISGASAEAVALAHQLHGAIGFTEEYGLQRLSKRLRVLRFAFGDGRHHHRTLGLATSLRAPDRPGVDGRPAGPASARGPD